MTDPQRRNFYVAMVRDVQQRRGLSEQSARVAAAFVVVLSLLGLALMLAAAIGAFITEPRFRPLAVLLGLGAISGASLLLAYQHVRPLTPTRSSVCIVLTILGVAMAFGLRAYTIAIVPLLIAQVLLFLPLPGDDRS